MGGVEVLFHSFLTSALDGAEGVKLLTCAIVLFDHPKIICRTAQIMKPHIIQFFQASLTSSHILLSNPPIYILHLR